MDKPTVFISYSHKDEAWKNLLRPHLALLEQTDQIVIWDDRQIDAGDEWYQRIRQTMERAAVTVCLISADYLASNFCQKEEIPFLLNRRKDDGMLLLPLLVRPCLWKAVPWLRQLQMLPRDGKSISRDFREDPDEVFTSIAEQVFDFVSQLKPAIEAASTKSIPIIQVSGERNIIINGNVYQSALVSGDFNTLLQAPPAPQWPALPEDKISLERLPVTGKELFGRDEQLNLLDEAWEKNETSLLSFVAWGGVGKSTLVNKWLERLAKDNYRGAWRVFAWSFYSQGTSDRVTSADLFINAALTWFGDEDPTVGSPWDKGERLARLIRQQRTLLLLDGMEPLQSANNFERGKIKDPALATLVEELARENPGLCVITTRESISDLEERFSTGSGSDRVSPTAPNANHPLATARGTDTVQQINLELLSPEAGRALLRIGGVRGTDEELERAAESFGCHALALNLLAVYLHDIPGHHVSAAAQIPDLNIPIAEGKHPRRMIAALADRFGDSAELNVLRLLGLFDRPADGKSIAALRQAPKIPALTDHIGEDAEAAWLRAVQKLRKLKLIAEESHHDPDELDAHPLVREHFHQQLRQCLPDAWRKANNRLYEHLCATTKELPETLEEMVPLFAATAHGCAAGRHREALEDVVWRRIRRGKEGFSLRSLGAFGADLAMLMGFFATPWQQPVDELAEAYQAFVLNEAGFALRALGRLKEAAQPMRAAVEMAIAQEDWENAAQGARNLSELYLALGEVAQSLASAQQSVELADQSGNSFFRMAFRTVLADALYQVGQVAEAEAAFREAEAMQKERQPSHPLLYSVWGFRYCDLLLGQGELREVCNRAAQMLEWEEEGWLLEIALDNLSLGRASLRLATGAGDYSEAADLLQRAVNGLRQAGTTHHVPRGLLARAELRRLTGAYPFAQADLAEAQRIAERGEMGLHLADCHLEWARLCLALGDRDSAHQHCETAKEMIERMGYHRRDGEVAELEQQLA